MGLSAEIEVALERVGAANLELSRSGVGRSDIELVTLAIGGLLAAIRTQQVNVRELAEMTARMNAWEIEAKNN